MSGIYIPGMEMPTSCDECRIMVFEDTNCIPELFCGCPIVFKAHPQGVGHRPDYCPLIEAPDHGRLIDADVVEKEIERYEKISGYPVGEEPKEFTGDDGWETVRYTAWMARFFIAEQNAPTIIPADKEEE